MTSGTRIGNSRVIKVRCTPVQGAMTGTAIQRGLDMVCRLAGNGHIVVTTLTGAGDFGVIKQAGRQPR